MLQNTKDKLSDSNIACDYERSPAPSDQNSYFSSSTHPLLGSLLVSTGVGHFSVVVYLLIVTLCLEPDIEST